MTRPSIHLLRLLGLSAFAGFVVLVVGWPLNNLVANRSVRIYKGLSTARDKRMGVLNELISAVCTCHMVSEYLYRSGNFSFR